MQKNNKEDSSRTSDLALTERISKHEDQGALQTLSDRHSPLFASIIIRLAKRFNNWSVVHDLIDEKDYVVYMAAKKYDASRNTKFSTFLGNEAKWAYLNKCNAQKKNSRYVYTDNEILENICRTEEDPLSSIVTKDTFDHIFNILAQHPDKRIKQIFSMRYKIGKSNKVMPWHLVGARMGLSAQGCINIHKIGINFIQDELTKEGILDVK